MNPSTQIENFLESVRKKRFRFFCLNGVYLLFIVLGLCAVVGNGLLYLFASARDYWIPFVLLCSLPLVYIFFTYFIRGSFASFGQDDAALLVEQHYPSLNNSLINSSQLKGALENPEIHSGTSIEFVEELLRRTEQQIKTISIDTLWNFKSLAKTRNTLLTLIATIALVSFTVPNFWGEGFKNLTAPPAGELMAQGESAGTALQPGTAQEMDFVISSIDLTFHYPAYTGLPSQTVSDSDGRVNVLPGTQVKVQAQIDPPVDLARLVFNKEYRLAMDSLRPSLMAGEFIARQPGVYQFEVETRGETILLEKEYPVTLSQDGVPRVVLFVANPKPVYYESDTINFSYESHDDFGVSSISLVAYVNGQESRIPIKKVKNRETEIKDSYKWSLATMNLGPGDQVEYFLEIKDNDNILGPNTGQSETFTFTIFDTQQEREDLIALQDDMIEKMITLLSKSLLGTRLYETDETPNIIRVRRFLSESTDQLIEIIGLAQHIQDRAKSIPTFPTSYLNLLKNIINGLNQIREQQIKSMKTLSGPSGQSTRISVRYPSIGPVNDKLIRHLEQDLLFLIKITNRQKMDQVMDLKSDLMEMAESLKEQFEKMKEQKEAGVTPEFQAQIEMLKQTLQKLMEQLASQTQSLPDEFLNSQAVKNLDLEKFNPAFDKLMELAKNGKIDEALEELQRMMDDLQTLANELNQANENMEDLIDTKLMEMIDDTLEDLDKLESGQSELLNETSEINQSLRKAQSEMFEDPLEKFFEELIADVKEVEDILDGDKSFIESHMIIEKFDKLLEQEAEISREVQELSQKSIDSEEEVSRQARFQELNEARKKLSHIHSAKDALRVNTVDRFRKGMPQLFEKYERLEELAELNDLLEFNVLFKNTFPDILRWSNNLRMSPDVREDIGERLEKDLLDITAINSRISSKLGSLNQKMQKDFQALIDQKTGEKLDQMAEQQQQLRQKSDEVAQMLSEMNQRNPMISPGLGSQMRGTGRTMGNARHHLKKHDVPNSVQSENRALKQIKDMKDQLNQLKNSNNAEGQQKGQKNVLKLGTGGSRDPRRGGSLRMQRERVNLPSEDQFKVPGEFREEILEAMKNQYPSKYKRFISEYYKELVK